MNLNLFEKLMVEGKEPRQRFYTWQKFLQICDTYLKEHEITCPIVVELGVMRNRQKKFYEQLFEAKHIGIDISNKKGEPDILGDLHCQKTLEKLKERLKGRRIDILFIDACHSYEAVKKDFEIYSPLCNGIIVLDDINLGRYRRKKGHGVWKFWDEIKLEEKYDNYLFLSITQYRDTSGLGMIIKK